MPVQLLRRLGADDQLPQPLLPPLPPLPLRAAPGQRLRAAAGAPVHGLPLGGRHLRVPLQAARLVAQPAPVAQVAPVVAADVPAAAPAAGRLLDAAVRARVGDAGCGADEGRRVARLQLLAQAGRRQQVRQLRQLRGGGGAAVQHPRLRRGRDHGGVQAGARRRPASRRARRSCWRRHRRIVLLLQQRLGCGWADEGVHAADGGQLLQEAGQRGVAGLLRGAGVQQRVAALGARRLVGVRPGVQRLDPAQLRRRPRLQLLRADQLIAAVRAGHRERPVLMRVLRPGGLRFLLQQLDGRACSVQASPHQACTRGRVVVCASSCSTIIWLLPTCPARRRGGREPGRGNAVTRCWGQATARKAKPLSYNHSPSA